MISNAIPIPMSYVLNLVCCLDLGILCLGSFLLIFLNHSTPTGSFSRIPLDGFQGPSDSIEPAAACFSQKTAEMDATSAVAAHAIFASDTAHESRA